MIKKERTSAPIMKKVKFNSKDAVLQTQFAVHRYPACLKWMVSQCLICKKKTELNIYSPKTSGASCSKADQR